MRSTWRAILTTGLLVAGCTAADVPTTPPMTAAPVESGAPSATSPMPGNPSPSRSLSPSVELRPPLAYPELQSYGSATLSFTAPAIPSTTYQLSCHWQPSWAYAYDPDSEVETRVYEGATFKGVRALEPFSVTLAGEAVDVWLGLDVAPDQAGDWASGTLFVIHRHGAASYVAGPQTGGVELVEAGPDRTSGALRFESLAPDPETAPLGQVALANWVRPLGGDPAMATLSGSLTWQCRPGPDTLATYDPSVNGWPEGWPFVSDRCDPYPLVLVSADQRRDGVRACTWCDLCGPGFSSIDPESVVRVPLGGTLRFELAEPDTHFVTWELAWANQREAERATELEQEDAGDPGNPFTVIDTGRISEGSVLEFPAPPAGEWSVRVGWHDHPVAYEAGMFAPGTDYFRVFVGE